MSESEVPKAVEMLDVNSYDLLKLTLFLNKNMVTVRTGENNSFLIILGWDACVGCFYISLSEHGTCSDAKAQKSLNLCDAA